MNKNNGKVSYITDYVGGFSMCMFKCYIQSKQTLKLWYSNRKLVFSQKSGMMDVER